MVRMGSRRAGRLGMAVGLALTSWSVALAEPSTLVETFRAYRASLDEKDYAAATTYAESALDMAVAQLGEDHAKTAALRLNLAELYARDPGKREQATALYSSAISALESEDEQQESALLVANRELARLLVASRNYDEANACYERALRLSKRQNGEDHPDLARLLIEVGDLHYLRGEEKAAKKSYRRAREIRKRIPAGDDVGVAESMAYEARVELAQGRFRGAQKLYEQAEEIWERTGATDHPARLMTLVDLVRVYSRRGRDELADEYLMKAAVAVPIEEQRRVGAPVRPPAVYPALAAERGQEGWVLVEFTVAESGRVLDPRVVNSDPGVVFDKSALEAVSQWRYWPELENGRPVRRTGVQTVVSFDLGGAQ